MTLRCSGVARGVTIGQWPNTEKYWYTYISENLDDVMLTLIVVGIYSNDREKSTDDILHRSNDQNNDRQFNRILTWKKLIPSLKVGNKDINSYLWIFWENIEFFWTQNDWCSLNRILERYKYKCWQYFLNLINKIPIRKRRCLWVPFESFT